jgi:putative acetyltransferase
LSAQKPVQVRLAEPADAPSISALLYESFVEFKHLYTEGGFAATTPPTEQILVRMGEGPVWVALVDDAIVATVSVVPKGESLYVRGMAVLPAARGNRIGELLSDRLEIYAAEHNFTRLFLSTTPFLDRAIRLYEKCGFRRTGEGPYDLFGTALFTMEKQRPSTRN